MKKLNIVLILLIISAVSFAQSPFVTTWNTTNPGVTVYNNQIVFPIVGTNYNISWRNTGVAADTGNAVGNGTDTITFANSGIYKVYISPGAGSVSSIAFNNSLNVDRLKILSIEQWGDIAWTTFKGAFSGCSNLILNAADAPNLSNVTNMSNAFSYCNKFTGNTSMNNWNVSNIDTMEYVFARDSFFNQNISNWHVSNVKDMGHLFEGDLSFNQPLNSWDVSNVTNMQSMFNEDTSFNQALNNWNVSHVTNMGALFGTCLSFNQDISNWDVSNVNDMGFMFAGASAFNTPLNNWNVSKLEYAEEMFAGAISFNQPLDNWDVSKTVSMYGMFASNNFNQPLNNWNTGKVIDFRYMFSASKNFNQPLNNWHTGNAIQMAGMFQGADSFNQPLNNWKVDSVNNMWSMFENAKAFNQSLESWSPSTYRNLTSFLDSCGMDCSNYSLTLKAWANNTSTPNSLTLGAAGLSYDSAYADAAHKTLVTTKDWTIAGDVKSHCTIIPTGIADIENNASFILFPNPAANEVQVKCSEDILFTILTDMSGKEVFAQQNSNTGSIIIPTAALANGVYFIRLTTQSSTTTKKILIQH